MLLPAELDNDRERYAAAAFLGVNLLLEQLAVYVLAERGQLLFD